MASCTTTTDIVLYKTDFSEENLQDMDFKIFTGHTFDIALKKAMSEGYNMIVVSYTEFVSAMGITQINVALITEKKAFTDIRDVVAWLSAQLDNTIDTPYSIRLKGPLPSVDDLYSVLDTTGKFVSLDLSIGKGITEWPSSENKSSDKISAIIFPKILVSIEDSAFAGCSSLSSVTLPASMTSIGDSVFAGCSSLSSVTLPAGMTSIGDSAFSSCTSLSSISIPNSITSIGNNAFDGCIGLTSVTFASGSIATWGGDNEFPGNLKAMYQAGGAGTYTQSGSNMWTKLEPTR